MHPIDRSRGGRRERVRPPALANLTLLNVVHVFQKDFPCPVNRSRPDRADDLSLTGRDDAAHSNRMHSSRRGKQPQPRPGPM